MGVVHEHRLYYMDGLYTAQSAVYLSLSLVHVPVLNICMGRMDKRINGYDSQLLANCNDRCNSLHQDDNSMKELYTTNDGKEFIIIAEYCPNEDNDVWVEYINTKTQQRYNCRKAAFLARTSRQLLA